MIHYNKVYQSIKKVSAEWHAGHIEWSFAWDYLRFYEDGTVINCFSSDNLVSINTWFHRDNKESHFGIGEYTIKHNAVIEIKIPVMVGTIEMDGNIFDDYLILRCFNKEIKQGENWDQYLVIE